LDLEGHASTDLVLQVEVPREEESVDILKLSKPEELELTIVVDLQEMCANGS